MKFLTTFVVLSFQVFSLQSFAGGLRLNAKTIVSTLTNSVQEFQTASAVASPSPLPSATPTPGPLYTDLAKQQLDTLFQTYSLKVGKTVCVPVDGIGDALSQFFSAYESELPEIEQICLHRGGAYKVHADVQFTTTPFTRMLEQAGDSLPAVDVWFLDILPEFSFVNMLKGLWISTDSYGSPTIDVSVDNQKVQVDVNGIGVSAIGPKLFGSVSIPDSMMNFGFNGITVDNNGNFELFASAPVLDIPISYSSSLNDFTHGFLDILWFIKIKIGS